jgi:fructan beta-fructosidase
VYREPYRPQFHFSPATGWLNDPNGLIFYDGEYHLFYQHIPGNFGDHGAHWGHAVSADLVHWQQLPIALYPDQLGAIWSGSAVIDRENTSGFQTGDEKVMVAFFTHRDDAGLQQQSLAYSNDRGRTWTKYPDNPVIPNPGLLDFRDPKVFWHSASSRWVMVVVAGMRVMIYSSNDLKHWSFASEFGAGQGSQRGVWECPDLFELTVDGDPTHRKWILLVSVAHHQVAEEPAMQYFVGEFDGNTFSSSTSPETIRWLDHGSDNYAGVTFNNIPPEDGRRIMIGWMNHWWYARNVPTSPWRGAMTVPQELMLTSDGTGRLHLLSTPVAELRDIRGQHRRTERQVLTEATSLSLKDVTQNGAFEVAVEFRVGSAGEFGVILSNEHGEQAVAGYMVETNEVFVDRRDAGEADFHPIFAAHIQRAPLEPESGVVQLRVLVDWSSVELFANDGRAVITDLIFPQGGFNELGLYAKNGDVTLVRGDVWELSSIWER